MRRPALPPEEFVQKLSAARNGNSTARGELFERCRPYLLVVAHLQKHRDLTSKIGDSDHVQDTFLDAHRWFADFRGSTEQELLAWLRQSLLNHIANQLRKFRYSSKRAVHREAPLPEAWQEASKQDALLDMRNSPDVALTAKLEADGVRYALQTLGDVPRKVFEMRYHDQLEWEDIGKQLGISGDAARKQWARALRSLSRMLQCLQLQTWCPT